MVKKKSLEWKFPGKKIILLKLETIIIAKLCLLIFFITFIQSKDIILATLYTIIFVIIYVIVNYVVNQLRKVEYHYHLTDKNLKITKKVNLNVEKEVVIIKKIHHYKLDHFLLGGYALSDKGKHLLYFNDKKELDKFERHLKKK